MSILAFCMGITTYSQCVAQNNTPTLVESAQAVLTVHPDILAKKAARESKNHAIEGAQAPYFPKFDMEVKGGYDYTHQKFKNNQLSSAVRGVHTSDHYETTLKLNQMLFDGFETEALVDQAEAEAKEAHMNFQETKEKMLLEAVLKYIDVRRFDRLIKLSQDNNHVHQEMVEKIQESINSGNRTLSDLQNAKAHLYDTIAQEKNVLLQKDIAVSQFIEIMLPATLEEAIAIAQERSPSYLRAQATLKLAKSIVETTKKRDATKINFELNATRRLNAFGKSGAENSLTALAKIKFNLYDADRSNATTREYYAKSKSAAYQVKKERMMMEADVRKAWTDFQNLSEQIKASSKEVEEKNTLRAQYVAQFNTGMRRLEDIINIFHDYFIAKGELVTQQARHDATYFSLLSVMGQLEEALIKENVDQLVLPTGVISDSENEPSVVPDAAMTAVDESSDSTDVSSATADESGIAEDESSTAENEPSVVPDAAMTAVDESSDSTDVSSVTADEASDSTDEEEEIYKPAPVDSVALDLDEE